MVPQPTIPSSSREKAIQTAQMRVNQAFGFTAMPPMEAISIRMPSFGN